MTWLLCLMLFLWLPVPWIVLSLSADLDAAQARLAHQEHLCKMDRAWLELRRSFDKASIKRSSFGRDPAAQPEEVRGGADMLSSECLNLKVGTVVLVRWPGANSGQDSKRAVMHHANRAGTKVAVRVARTTPDGRYTGEYGTSVRWFDCSDILGLE